MSVLHRWLKTRPWVEVELEHEGGVWVLYVYDTRTKDLDWTTYTNREDAVKAFKAAK